MPPVRSAAVVRKALSQGSPLFFSSEKKLPRILRQEILAVLRVKGCRASFNFRVVEFDLGKS